MQHGVLRHRDHVVEARFGIQKTEDLGDREDPVEPDERTGLWKRRPQQREQPAQHPNRPRHPRRVAGTQHGRAQILFPLQVEGQEREQWQIAPTASIPAGARIAVFSRGPSDSAWIRHAEACVRSGTELPPARATVEPSSPVDALTPADALSLYDRLAESGIVYGWSFRCLSKLRLASEEAMAEVSLQTTMADGGIEAHPVLLEACTQVAAAAAGDFMPLVLAGWDRLWASRSASRSRRVSCPPAPSAGNRRRFRAGDPQWRYAVVLTLRSGAGRRAGHLLAATCRAPSLRLLFRTTDCARMTTSLRTGMDSARSRSPGP